MLVCIIFNDVPSLSRIYHPRSKFESYLSPRSKFESYLAPTVQVWVVSITYGPSLSRIYHRRSKFESYLSPTVQVWLLSIPHGPSVSPIYHTRFKFDSYLSPTELDSKPLCNTVPLKPCAIPVQKKDKIRRQGKGHRVCLGGKICSIPCRAGCFASVDL